MKPNKSIIATLLCLICFNGIAKEGDLDQEVKISASSQEADIKNNQLIFNGPVIVTQGTIRINAEELQAFSKNDDTARTLVATGNPATYTQIMDDGRPAQASALEIHYELSTRTLTLIGEATLAQGGSRVTGSRIRYNIEQQKLLAESSGKGQDRVITIIQPETYKKSTSNNPPFITEKTPTDSTSKPQITPASPSTGKQQSSPQQKQEEAIKKAIEPTQKQQNNITQAAEKISTQTHLDVTDESALKAELSQLANQRKQLTAQLTQLMADEAPTDVTPSQLSLKKAYLQTQIDNLKPQQKQLEAQLSQLIPSATQLKAISAQLADEQTSLQSLTSKLTTSAQAVSASNAIQGVKADSTQEQQE